MHFIFKCVPLLTFCYYFLQLHFPRPWGLCVWAGRGDSLFWGFVWTGWGWWEDRGDGWISADPDIKLQLWAESQPPTDPAPDWPARIFCADQKSLCRRSAKLKLRQAVKYALSSPRWPVVDVCVLTQLISFIYHATVCKLLSATEHMLTKQP